MNPFQKLRRAVDRHTINYEIQGQPETPSSNDSPMLRQEQGMKRTVSKSPIKQPSNLAPVLLEQQAKYIQEINDLSVKNERLTKALKLAQIEKQQQIQQICTLEKNIQILQEKMKEIYQNYGEADGKERKYQQEIYRINKTVEMLGKQINEQRNGKKAIIAEFNRYKQENNKVKEKDSKTLRDLEDKIKVLEEQLKERTSLLEYNIMKNSQQRKQNRVYVENMKAVHEDRVEELNSIIMGLKDENNNLKMNYEILSHKFEGALLKSEGFQAQNGQINAELAGLNQRNRSMEQRLKEYEQRLSQMEQQNNKLTAQLKQARENVRVKVVEIKDEALQMQLQMYKRQCKDLLQDRAISQKLSIERNYQPSYQLTNK